MIRALVLILGLLLGLTAAVTLAGRMSHLRMVFGADLPTWTLGIDDSAGVLSGHGQVNSADLRWHLARVDLQGPHWQVTLGGADWQVDTDARVGGLSMVFDGVNGLTPASQITDTARGMIAITAGELTLSLPGGALVSGQLQGRARDLELGDPVADGPVRDGPVLDGPVTLVWADGVWRVN